MKGSTNALYCIKQALRAFCPSLKNALLPSNIRKHESSMEKEGVISSRLIDVNCTITEIGNERGMCTFYYCSRPVELLGLMLCRMFLDNACKSSLSFAALIDMLVVMVGFDKSDSDLSRT